MIEGHKQDLGKPRMDLMCFDALEGLAQTLTYGANKYDDHNWQLGIANSRLVASLLRHLSAYQRGEDIDPESGLPHLDHVLCNSMFLSSNFKLRKHCDTRWTDPRSAGLSEQPGSTAAGVSRSVPEVGGAGNEQGNNLGFVELWPSAASAPEFFRGLLDAMRFEQIIAPLEKDEE